jgi:hypothetical protein
MVLGHLSDKFNYYSFHTGDIMYFVSFLLNFCLQWSRGFTAFYPLGYILKLPSNVSSLLCFLASATVSYMQRQSVVNMVHHITNFTKEYQDNLREMPYVPKTSFQRDSL